MPNAVPSKHVLIVSGNDDTARHLKDYLVSRGLRANVKAKLPTEFGQDPPDAVVLFPDEFKKDDVEPRVRKLLTDNECVTLTVVTANTQRFEGLAMRLEDTQTSRLSVLPRPAFSWTILDHVISPLATKAKSNPL